MRMRGAFCVAIAWAAALAMAGCRQASSPPVSTCTDACAKRAASHCSEKECARGCTFVLDRLVEHEQEAVLACVEKTKGACDDPLWADCAVRLGEHADGGPPPPPPPAEE